MRTGRSRHAWLVGLAVPATAGLALITASPALAQPYRWVDERGDVHYTDQPPPHGGIKVENMNPTVRRRAAEAPPSERRQPESSAAETQATKPAPGGTAAPSRQDPPAQLETPAPPTTQARPPAPSRRAQPTDPAPATARQAPQTDPEPAPSHRAPPTDPEPAPPRPGAAITAPDVPEAARELMALSGIDQWLDHAVALARNEFRPLRWRLDDPEAAWGAVARGFRRDEMAPVAARCLLEELTEAEREGALARLRSPLLQRTRQLRDDALTPARQPEYRAFVTRLPGALPAAARLALVQALERDNHAATFQVEVERAVRRAVGNALQPLIGGSRRATAEYDAEARPDGDEDHMRFYNVTMMLFAYRALPDTDLQEMVRSTRSPEAVRFNEAYQGCIRAALTAAERRAALEVRPLARRVPR